MRAMEREAFDREIVRLFPLSPAALRVSARRPEGEAEEMLALLRSFADADFVLDFMEAVRDCLRGGTSAGARLCTRVTGVARAETAAKTASVKMRHTFLNFIEVCGELQSFFSVCHTWAFGRVSMRMRICPIRFGLNCCTFLNIGRWCQSSVSLCRISLHSNV
jgi:hypothetical protein